MKFKDIHIGDVLQIRSWEDMAKEFGVCRGSGRVTYIATKSPDISFLSYMRYLCGKTFTVSAIDEENELLSSVEGCERSSYPENSWGKDWKITAPMLCLVIPDAPEDSFEPVDLSGFLA